MSQKNLAEVLHVNPENLIIGNGATELIVLINMCLIDRIAVPVPTFGEYIEKLRDQRDAELYFLDPDDHYTASPGRLSGLGAPARPEGPADHQSGESHRPVDSARRDGSISCTTRRTSNW